jgi:hypothetical protein|tara:strand:- start:1154 stop:1462 length:309 start_codon:yes stop_codon:yes gene_type:complete
MVEPLPPQVEVPVVDTLVDWKMDTLAVVAVVQLMTNRVALLTAQQIKDLSVVMVQPAILTVVVAVVASVVRVKMLQVVGAEMVELDYKLKLQVHLQYKELVL